METLKNLFAAIQNSCKNAWDSLIDNLGWVLSICFGGLWFYILFASGYPVLFILVWLTQQALIAMGAYWLCATLVHLVMALFAKDDVIEVQAQPAPATS